MKHISVIINKNWESEPILNALTNPEIRPGKLPFPQVINTPKDKNDKSDKPRAIYQLPELQITIWCIQDLMYFNLAHDPATQSSSSSEEKFRVLQPILKADNPDFVIAVGTAGYPSNTSYNGSVVIGANYFIHNGHPKNPKSNLDHPDIGKILLSNVNEKLFDIVNKDFKNLTEPKFIQTPRNPAFHSVCIASKVYTAVSSINVTDYSEYNWVDHEAIEHYHSIESKMPFNSLETTHGVIKFSTSKPIIFLSAITDSLGQFDVEVTASQNYTASFNAGIVLGQLFCDLSDFVVKGGGFEK